MIAIYIILGILASLLLLLLLPFHLRATYRDSLKVKVRYAFLFYTVYPRPEKEEKKAKKEEEEGKREKAEKKELSEIERMLKEEGVAEVIDYLRELARLAGTAFRKAIASITADCLMLKIKVASGDAASTAVDYGRVCAAVYPAEGLMESIMHVRHRSISITPDFLGEKSEIQGEIRLHILPIRILWIALQFFIGYIGNTKVKNQ